MLSYGDAENGDLQVFEKYGYERWLVMKPKLTRIYCEENQPLKTLMTVLRNEDNFIPTCVAECGQVLLTVLTEAENMLSKRSLNNGA